MKVNFSLLQEPIEFTMMFEGIPMNWSLDNKTPLISLWLLCVPVSSKEACDKDKSRGLRSQEFKA